MSFKFTNSGPDTSSITQAYFDDGTLLGLASVMNGTGVNFAAGANPSNLPAGNNASPAFVASFGASSQPNGVNPGEELTLVFDLQSGKTFADTLSAIADGSLRVGIHIQGFATGGSESFVNVPEPGVALLLAAPLLGMALRVRQR